MKLTFKKLALLGLSIVAMFVLVGCKDTTTTTTITTSGSDTTTGLTDTQKVQAVLDGITLGDVTAVTEDLTLPTASVNGVSLSWTTEDADVVSALGEITVPTYAEGDATITLTLTATLNSVSLTKEFEVTVSAETAQVFLARVGNSIIIDSSDSIVANFKLPYFAQGATIVWTSANVTVAAISATANEAGEYTVTITRPKAEDGGVNTSVALTASLTIDNVTIQVEKSIRVIAEPPATVYESFATLHSTAVLKDYVDLTGVVYSKFKLGYFITDGLGNYAAVYTTETRANAVAVGDEVRIKGSYSVYNTLYQISTLTFQEVLSSDNDIEVTPVVFEDATDLLDVNPANKLIHGQVYTITVTPQLRGAYNNVYLYSGSTQVATVYYNSNAASINALKEFVGKVVTIDVVYYTFYSGSSVLTPGVAEVYITFDGLAADIVEAPLEGQEALDADAAAIIMPSTAVGGQSITLPVLGGYGSAITWSVKTGSEYASIASGKVVLTDVTVAQSVVLTASLTITGVVEPTTKDFTISVTPITTSSIAQVWTKAKNDLAQVEGTVYFFINNGFYVFDGTGLLFIYTTAPVGTALGDKLVIFGTVDIYNGQHQIKSATVKSVTSTGNAHEQTATPYVPGTTALVSGQTYAVTGTVAIAGTYNNVYIYNGATLVATIYYRSTINDSYNVLKAEVGNEVVINLVYYYTAFDSGLSLADVVHFVYQEGAAGIGYTDAQQAALNVEALTTKTSVVSAEAVILPASSGTSAVTWAVKDANVNATIASGVVTYATVETATEVTLVATITYTPTVGSPIVNTKEFVVTISTYAEKLVDDVAALTVSLTATELSTITLPVAGLNGSVVTWALAATDNATLVGNVLTLEFAGVEYSVVLTATLSFTASPATTDTKEFTIVVSPVVLVTEFSVFNEKTGADWTFAGTDMMYIKGIVAAKNGTSGFFLQDASGDGIYAHGSHTVSVGDEVVIYTKLGFYNQIRQLNTWSVKAVLTTGNTPVVLSMTYAELGAILPTFYEYGNRLVNVSGIEIKEFRGNYLDMIWTTVAGDTPVVYMLSFYYNNSTYSWLKDVYAVGDFLPAFDFVLYNIYATTTFNILPQAGLVMTEQQAVDINKDLLPTSLELLADYTIPTAVFGATITITNISAELTAYLTNAGVVTLPETDAVGTITFTVTKGLISDTVVVPVTVKAMNDAQKLALAVADLPTTLILGDDLTLPTTLYSATYETVVIAVGLQANLDYVLGDLVVTRPASGLASVSGTVTVTLKIGSETQEKIINVTVKAYATDLFISYYMEGDGGNKKILAVHNDTGADVDLANYKLGSINNPSATPLASALTGPTLTGTLAQGKTLIIHHADMLTFGNTSYFEPLVTALSTLPSGNIVVAYSLTFNGERSDIIALTKNVETVWTFIDMIGIYDAPLASGSTAWETAYTKNKTLVRSTLITSPVTTTNWDEWVVGAQNSFDSKLIGWY